jgi:hypothetical protein
MGSAVEIVRSFYAAVGRGDVQAVLNLLHPELDRGGRISLLRRYVAPSPRCPRETAGAALSRLGEFLGFRGRLYRRRRPGCEPRVLFRGRQGNEEGYAGRVCSRLAHQGRQARSFRYVHRLLPGPASDRVLMSHGARQSRSRATVDFQQSNAPTRVSSLALHGCDLRRLDGACIQK